MEVTERNTVKLTNETYRGLLDPRDFGYAGTAVGFWRSPRGQAKLRGLR